MFSRTFQTIFFLQYFILFEFKPFLNFIFWQPVWSNRQPQYIVPNSLKSLETRKNRIYCVFDFIIWLFDLQSDILFLAFIFKKNVPNVSHNFSQRTLQNLSSLMVCVWFDPFWIQKAHFQCYLLLASLRLTSSVLPRLTGG